MSMRRSVGKSQIEEFFIQVGRTRQSGRLYITRGAALVHRGIRPGQTLDIDIHVTELDLLCQDVLNKIGKPPYNTLLPNLSTQQFSLNYQAVRGLL